MILFWGQEGPYAFLSNFYPSPFTDVEGIVWPTIEHYFQAMKSTSSQKRQEFARLTTPLKAKRAGRKVALRSDWEQVKVSVMCTALTYKFTQNLDLQEKLLATGDEVLHEDSPYDFVWGWQDGGQDLLGKCLMQIRSELIG